MNEENNMKPEDKALTEAEAEIAAEEGDAANDKKRLEWVGGIFSDIGAKLKIMAVVLLIVGILGSIAGGILILSLKLIDPSWIAFPLMLAGGLVSWVVSCVVYAIGALADKYL